jgi:hypothetical protein
MGPRNTNNADDLFHIVRFALKVWYRLFFIMFLWWLMIELVDMGLRQLVSQDISCWAIWRDNSTAGVLFGPYVMGPFADLAETIRYPIRSSV